MKTMGSTHRLQLKLLLLSEVEVGGIPGVAVKCVEICLLYTSDSNITPDKTLADILELKAWTGHSTVCLLYTSDIILFVKQVTG